MGKQSGTGQPGIRPRQVPQSIRLLRALDVPATRLAGIFGESADNIRHIDSRAYGQTPPRIRVAAFPNSEDLALLKQSPTERQAQFLRNIFRLRLRSKQDLDQVEATIWAIFNSHKSTNLRDGYEALLLLKPTVANGRHAQALRIRLLLEEKLAWFALPLGMIEGALFHARRSLRLAIRAFRESAGEKGYLLRYGESALIASICLQKLHRHGEAVEFIKAADEANRATGQLPGSEHLRQRGVSFTAMGSDYDEQADQAFASAAERMQRKDEARHPVDIAMSSLRQQTFLRPVWGWEKALELLEIVKNTYGEESMQFAVATQSAALTGLRLGTAQTDETALRLLRAISGKPSVGAAHILAITPELKLSTEDRDRWLRFALTETPIPIRK